MFVVDRFRFAHNGNNVSSDYVVPSVILWHSRSPVACQSRDMMEVCHAFNAQDIHLLKHPSGDVLRELLIARECPWIRFRVCRLVAEGGYATDPEGTTMAGLRELKTATRPSCEPAQRPSPPRSETLTSVSALESLSESAAKLLGSAVRMKLRSREELEACGTLARRTGTVAIRMG